MDRADYILRHVKQWLPGSEFKYRGVRFKKFPNDRLGCTRYMVFWKGNYIDNIVLDNFDSQEFRGVVDDIRKANPLHRRGWLDYNNTNSRRYVNE